MCYNPAASQIPFPLSLFSTLKRLGSPLAGEHIQQVGKSTVGVLNLLGCVENRLSKPGAAIAVIDPTDIRLDDVVRMRKPHPCGGYEWRVVRLGTDIGVRCLTCGRKVLMPRSQYAKRVKTIVQRAPENDV
jgi:hypothetical protein